MRNLNCSAGGPPEPAPTPASSPLGPMLAILEALRADILARRPDLAPLAVAAAKFGADPDADDPDADDADPYGLRAHRKNSGWRVDFTQGLLKPPGA